MQYLCTTFHSQCKHIINITAINTSIVCRHVVYVGASTASYKKTFEPLDL